MSASTRQREQEPRYERRELPPPPWWLVRWRVQRARVALRLGNMERYSAIVCRLTDHTSHDQWEWAKGELRRA